VSTGTLVSRLRQRLAGSLHLELFLGLGMKAAGAGSSFVFTWLVARGFGADTIGRFQIALLTVTMTSVFTGLALDNIMLRTVARALGTNRLADALASFVRALLITLVTTGGAALLVFAGAPYFSTNLLGSPEVATFLRVLAPGIVLFALIRVAAALLRSRGKLLFSQSLDGVGYTTVAMFILVVAWAVGAAKLPLLVPVAYLCGLLVAAALGLLVARREVAPWPRGGTPDISIRAGAILAWVYLAIQASDWIGLLVVTRHLGTDGAGVYRVAFQVCMLFLIVNTAFTVMMGPHLAAATGARDRAGIIRVIRTASGTGLLICAPLFILILLWAEPILSLFGPEFIQGGRALRVLALAQLLSVGFGPVGTALMMMHREKLMLAIESAATTLAVATALWAVPRYGMIGAATAALLASVVRNGGGFVSVRLILRSMPRSAQ
jgi:O-antigen/teichoic acid export membrane protein